MEPITSRQRSIYTLASLFVSLILAALLNVFGLVTNGFVLLGFVVIIVIVAYKNPSIGRRLATLWVAWSGIGSRGYSNQTGVKLADDLAKGKASIDQNIEPRAVKVVIIVVIGIIVLAIVIASLLN